MGNYNKWSYFNIYILVYSVNTDKDKLSYLPMLAQFKYIRTAFSVFIFASTLTCHKRDCHS